MVADIAKHIGIGAGIGIGADYVVERFGGPMSPIAFLNNGQPSLIQTILYGGGGLLAVLGFVGGQSHYEYIPIGLSVIVGTWLYEHYLARLLGVRRIAYNSSMCGPGASLNANGMCVGLPFP